MKLNPNATYSRANSVLLENGVEILKFTQEFPVNIEKLGAKAIEYHEKYITANPTLVEWLIEEEEQFEYFAEEIHADRHNRVFKVDPVEPTEDPYKMADAIEEAKPHVIIKGTANSRDAVYIPDEGKHGIVRDDIPPPGISRKEEVRWYMNNGDKSPSSIAKKLGTNASYVQRLKKEIENENL